MIPAWQRQVRLVIQTEKAINLSDSCLISSFHTKLSYTMLFCFFIGRFLIYTVLSLCLNDSARGIMAQMRNEPCVIMHIYMWVMCHGWWIFGGQSDVGKHVGHANCTLVHAGIHPCTHLEEKTLEQLAQPKSHRLTYPGSALIIFSTYRPYDARTIPSRHATVIA